MVRWVSATGSRTAPDGHKPMHAQHRALDAIAGLAAGIDEHAGAGAIARPDLARGVGDADGGHQPARSDDFAHDDGLIQIAARRGQQHGVAAARWASSSRSRNQLAAAAPIVPLMASAAPAAARAVEVGTRRSATTSCSARRTGLSSRPRPRAATGPGRRGCRRRQPAERRSMTDQMRPSPAAGRGAAAPQAARPAGARRRDPRAGRRPLESAVSRPGDHRLTIRSSRQSTGRVAPARASTRLRSRRICE